ncbi:MAG: hypothetical protein ACM3ZU_08370 [Bacteroidota bacterium]
MAEITKPDWGGGSWWWIIIIIIIIIIIFIPICFLFFPIFSK